MTEQPNFKTPVLGEDRKLFAGPWQRWLARLFSQIDKVPGKFTAAGPPSDGMLWTVTHGLNTSSFTFQVKEISTGMVFPETVQVLSDNQILVTLNIPAAANTLEITVIG